MLLQEAAAERVIDRDFDQTAPHVHLKEADCPTCKAAAGNDADAGPQRVSPSILEFRIQELEREVENVTDLYRRACYERDAAQMRVVQFERFTDILANHLDALMQISHPAKPNADLPKAA